MAVPNPAAPNNRITIATEEMAILKAITSEKIDTKNMITVNGNRTDGFFGEIFNRPIAISPPNIPKKRMTEAMIARLSI